MSVTSWLASPPLKDAAVAEVRGHRAAGTLVRRRDQPVRAEADGRFQGGFHVCLTARRLAVDRGVTVARLLANGGEDIDWLDESERLWGIARIAGALLDRCFEQVPAAEAADFAVTAVQAIPVGANLDLIGAQWMLDVLADEHDGVLAWPLTDAARAAVARVAALYRRRLAGERVDTEEWTAAAAQAQAAGAQARGADPRGIDGPAAATAHAAAAAYAPTALPMEVRAAAWKASRGLADEEAAIAYQAAYIEAEAIVQAAQYAVNTVEAVADAEFHIVFDPIREAATRGRAALEAGRVPAPADAAAVERARQAGQAGVARRTEYHRWRARRLIRRLGDAPVGE
jgi:hypothetical protein